MSAARKRLVIVGCGLIGTSIGLAARAEGLHVALVDTDPAVARRAADLGAGTVRPHPEGADLAVLAVPPQHVAPTLLAAQRDGLARAYCDVASVKARPLADAAALGCDLTSFVGSHPMSGRERSGPGAARADLFAGRPWVICPEQAAQEHVRAVVALARSCGAVPVVLSVHEHDEAVALVSHAPQTVATLMAARLADAPERELALSGQGVRDVTRLAASDPALWLAILAANAGPVSTVLRALRADLDELLDALAAVERGGDDAAGGRAAVFDALSRGTAGRARLPGKHGAAPTAYATVPVVVEDRPGELARLLLAAGTAGVNVEDVSIEHSPGQPVGSVELAVRPEAADRLAAALRDGGWTVHR